MANTDEVIETVSDKDIAALHALVTALGGRDRKVRQSSAHTIALVAKAVPAAVVPFVDDLVAAIDRPEAQTRWEVLDALASVAAVDPAVCAQAYEGAENSLYDEESGMVRLAAFRYFIALGSCGPDWSAKVWPLIDEAVQCYHGDPEFEDMLDALVAFAQADLAPEVRKALGARMAFDARNARGVLAARARQIVDLTK